MSEPHSRPPRDNGANVKVSRDNGANVKVSRDNGANVKVSRDGGMGVKNPPETGGAAGDDSLVAMVRGWVRALRRAKGGESVREALEDLIDDRDDTGIPIDDHERILLGNILHLRDVTAYDVMVPRADIQGVEDGTTLDDLIDLFIRCGHSRLPVHRGTLDDIIGMVHIKDVLAATRSDQSFHLPHIMRRVLFVSPAMRVPDMLLEMRLKRTHMALVVDEYGGIDGLVTTEDLVEQIVGEIEDEHDEHDDPVMSIAADGTIEADARASIEEFEAALGAVLTDEERDEVDTLGGLVFFIAGRIPSRGELIVHSSGLEFEVVDADPRRIKWLRVRRLLPVADDQS
ncbi:Hemolysin C [Magnetospirillum gryphiswaldense MSR-1]|uniref:Hemolysin n=2 Tax=Magnetospirillum gryphiswaldense TaxID=55518 RepID=A4U0M1_9PROT|nr:Hemolysin C [Magnetospirillum gryphiswaldense MSR-1]AVM79233.1 Hemolysin C [Magnetospirillum gryphiswaldense]CAM76428.1 hemolysin [Magnetospirillum gryphiswaldense MSR-1]